MAGIPQAFSHRSLLFVLNSMSRNQNLIGWYSWQAQKAQF